MSTPKQVLGDLLETLPDQIVQNVCDREPGDVTCPDMLLISVGDLRDACASELMNMIANLEEDEPKLADQEHGFAIEETLGTDPAHADQMVIINKDGFGLSE